MYNPTVDILMATYNGEHYIAEQIESLQRQTYKNWRLLVSDDSSNDKTLGIVREYSEADARISIVSKGIRYGGSKENFMALLSVSEAPYVMFCDQDDVWLPRKIEREICALQSIEDNSSVDNPVMVHTDLSLVDATCRPLGILMSETLGVNPRTATTAQMILTGCVTGCTIAMNRKCVKDALAYRDISNILMHDWWIALISSYLGVRLFLDEPLVYYRQHSNNVVGAAVSPLSEIISRYGNIQKNRGIIGVKDHLVDGELDRINQAEEFVNCFRQRLSPNQIDEINSIIAIPELDIKARIEIMNRLHLWCRGEKNRLRQTTSLFLMKKQRPADQ